MKILRTNQFIAERVKVKPITNAELDRIQQDIVQNRYNRYYELTHCPSTKKALKRLILERIEKDGYKCDLNDICTKYITDMSGLFADLHEFNGDISQWDVSNVRDMNHMFEYCTLLSSIDVSNLIHLM